MKSAYVPSFARAKGIPSQRAHHVNVDVPERGILARVPGEKGLEGKTDAERAEIAERYQLIFEARAEAERWAEIRTRNQGPLAVDRSRRSRNGDPMNSHQ